VVPGLETPDNLKTAQQAIDIFQEVLAKDPKDVNSLKQVAGIDFSVKKLDDAKEWQKKVLQEDPKDPEAAYTVGVIDWMQAHQNTLSALAPAGPERRRRGQRQGAQEDHGSAQGSEYPAGSGSYAISQPGAGEPAQL
jgi:tetratricopeptide (TPR) repeat protein